MMSEPRFKDFNRGRRKGGKNMANSVFSSRDDIVTFFRLSSSELDTLEKVKGQLIFTYDNAALYFDVPNWNKQSEEDPDIVRIHCDGVKFTLTREGQYLVLTSQDDPTVTQRVKLPSYTFTPSNLDKHIITIHCDDGTEDVVLDTTYTASDGVTLTGYNFTNSGIRDVTTGDQNGTIKINKNGTISNVPVYGLGTAAFVNKGVANGVAELDSNGLVPSSQLPSYVDDVVEGYYYESKFYQDSEHTIEITGEIGKIYVDLDTGRSFRWSGSIYIIVGDKIQSDWNINDSSQDAYVRNRTHYKEGNKNLTEEYNIYSSINNYRSPIYEEGHELDPAYIIGYRYSILLNNNYKRYDVEKFFNHPITVTIKGIDYTTILDTFDTEEQIWSGTFENGIKIRIYLYNNTTDVSEGEFIMELISTLATDNLFDNEEEEGN